MILHELAKFHYSSYSLKCVLLSFRYTKQISKNLAGITFKEWTVANVCCFYWKKIWLKLIEIDWNYLIEVLVYFLFANVAAIEICQLNLLGIKHWDDFRIFSLPWEYVGKKTAEDSAKTCLYCVNSGFSISWHFVKGYDLFF